MTDNGTTDISGFKSIKEVDTITIQRQSLNDLSGLSNLERINNCGTFDSNDLVSVGLSSLRYAGCLNLSGNNLTSVDGLNSLESVNGLLNLRYNNLETLSGLKNLKTINEDLNLQYNDNLSNLNGLESLTSVGKIIASENFINDISGLKSLKKAGSLQFNNYGNEIQDLTPLSNLNTVSIDVDFIDNDVRTLAGLENLESVGMDIAFWDNDNLTDISALSNLTFLGDDLIFDSDLSSREGFIGLDSNSWLCQPEQASHFYNGGSTEQAKLCN